MSYETEMRKVFRVLSLENQADLLIRAQQSHIDQEEIKNEKTFVYGGNTGLHGGIRGGDGAYPNSHP